MADVISKELREILDILVCPEPTCRKPLKLTPAEDAFKCAACKRVYPIRDGIPILLVEEAKIEE